MFDARLRHAIDPLLNRLALAISSTGISANMLTLAGGFLAVGAGAAIISDSFGTALLLIVLNRLLDGLDGAIARINGPTSFGGYLDSLADYLFYLAVPVGFGLADSANLVAALLLVASFTLTGVSFLAFAAISAKHGQKDAAHGPKAFFYSSGLMEGGETIAIFIAMCIWPDSFNSFALVFAGLCILTVAQRLFMAYRHLV